MDEGISKLLVELEDELKLIELDQANPLLNAQNSKVVCILKIDQIKAILLENDFKSHEDEIKFFKFQKPRFYERMHFYTMVQKYEIHKPHGSIKILKRYINKELSNQKDYFDINEEFYNYFRSNSSHLDEKYFLRKNLNSVYIDDFFLHDADPRFCTNRDYKVSRILACDRHQKFLNNQLLMLNKGQLTPVISFTSKLNWTGSKVGFAELIYALQSSNVIDNGTASVVDITNVLEFSFNTKGGNVYHSLTEISERKNEPLKLLGNMVICMMNKINDMRSK